MAFDVGFDGAVCVDALEHLSPEDWPAVLANFQQALKPGGWLYVTVEQADADEVQAAFAREQADGLPVVQGEVVEPLDRDTLIPAGLEWQPGMVVYHFYPAQDQVRAWFQQAGFAIQEAGFGDWYWHILARRMS